MRNVIGPGNTQHRFAWALAMDRRVRHCRGLEGKRSGRWSGGCQLKAAAGGVQGWPVMASRSAVIMLMLCLAAVER